MTQIFWHCYSLYECVSKIQRCPRTSTSMWSTNVYFTTISDVQ